ncbi:hypothetical protein [Paraburkholderia pallida]|uniref:Uncharacterized protein n=1 Tax=Paraburkholderia pallida TaxID=2547399 RepID=A0A4V1B0K8_9BURK|nr:hypothetical protein [Paraburkholderia pallida]QBR03123.1 hypothetical protein E1956_38795 [Paraburkholderia pallida]
MHQRSTFPSAYTREELASEIAHLRARMDSYLLCHQLNYQLVAQIEAASTREDRIRYLDELYVLMRHTAQSYPEFLEQPMAD